MASMKPPRADGAPHNSLDSDLSALLYEHGRPGIGITAVAVAVLASIVAGHPAARPWLALMWLLCAARAVDVFRLRPWRLKQGRTNGQKEINCYSAGTISQAVLWASLPTTHFIYPFSDPQILAIGTVMAGMAGGSVTVLSPVLRLGGAYCVLMILPVSALGISSTDSGLNVIGFLGIGYLLVLIASMRVSHRSVLRSLMLRRENRALMKEMESEQRRTHAAYLELAAAQEALKDVNQSLEDRIRERTLELERIALRDPLTGLLNRKSMSERLRAMLEVARGSGTQVAILFVDLDKFKEVNDIRGHLAGDSVLRVIASRLASGWPGEANSVARWGGDEFVAIIGISSLGEAFRLAQLLRSQVELPISLGSEQVAVVATVGIAIFPDHGADEDQLIRAADMAMYAGKQSGGGVRAFEQSLAESLRREHGLSQALRESIRARGFSLVYQPIIASPSNECVALEALLQWNHPELGPIPSGEFIPLAERTGDITALGRWALHEACGKAMAWPGENPPALSINVSAVQLRSGALFRDVTEALRESGLPPSRLHIEITETLFINERELAVETLRQLRELGVGIALDDFGTGYSSLAYLQNLPVDALKIDHSFVARMGKDSATIVSAIAMLARTFGFDLIAEGVESEEQHRRLLDLGVTRFQGFLFGRPMSNQEVSDWFEKRAVTSIERLAYATGEEKTKTMAASAPADIFPRPPSL